MSLRSANATEHKRNRMCATVWHTTMTASSRAQTQSESSIERVRERERLHKHQHTTTTGQSCSIQTAGSAHLTLATSFGFWQWLARAKYCTLMTWRGGAEGTVSNGVRMRACTPNIIRIIIVIGVVLSSDISEEEAIYQEIVFWRSAFGVAECVRVCVCVKYISSKRNALGI